MLTRVALRKSRQGQAQTLQHKLCRGGVMESWTCGVVELWSEQRGGEEGEPRMDSNKREWVGVYPIRSLRQAQDFQQASRNQEVRVSVEGLHLRAGRDLVHCGEVRQKGRD